MAITTDPALVTQGAGKRLTKRDADVFHRVMPVNVKVTLRLNLEIDQAMAGDLIEHVIEERNAGGKHLTTRTIEVDAHADLGFGGIAGDFSGSHRWARDGQALGATEMGAAATGGAAGSDFSASASAASIA